MSGWRDLGNRLLKEDSGMASNAGEVNEQLRKIIADQLGVEEERVTYEAHFIEDLNADSLDLVELIMALEEEFGVEISDEEANQLTTVGAAQEYISEHMS
jgi:acyl carrier protein